MSRPVTAELPAPVCDVPIRSADQALSTSERVTVVSCPTCGQVAAVGWVSNRPVEYDCRSGCRITAGELRHLIT